MITRQKLRYIFVIGIAIWLVGFALFIGSILLSAPTNIDEKTDVIVVLTGGEMRIETGLSLLADGLAEDLFITGVYPSVKKKDIVKKWKEDRPLPRCCITLGHKATTTQGNALEIKEWLENQPHKSIRLVTADFHMNRAMIEFRHQIPDIHIIPHPLRQPDATPSKRWFWVISFIEYHKSLLRWGSFMLEKPEAAKHGEHK